MTVLEHQNSANEMSRYAVIVVGGGHAGAEAAWAASNMLKAEYGTDTNQYGRVALITMDPGKTGAMSCNPAIGGLAKGQIVCEIDAMGGLMGLAADATGIQFRVLNSSKGPAVRGPRCQSDKYAYAEEVQRLLGTRKNIDHLQGTVDDVLVKAGRVVGAIYQNLNGEKIQLATQALVLTTGTFMRALMHTGEQKTEGGRVDEGTAVGISGTLSRLGFELGRLKTGTPPRLARETLDLKSLEPQPGDKNPRPFSHTTLAARQSIQTDLDHEVYASVMNHFPMLEQTPCWITHTNEKSHELIRCNLDRAPMYNGQIETSGPRYCPSIEDKVVRFSDRNSHHVFLEPESHRTNEVYCNGISTSLPADVQDQIIRALPGCEEAEVLRYGYAVEYDMVRPHQIDVTTMTKSLEGLFLAGQINGTSGYEEAAGQGMLAGINAVLYCRKEVLFHFGRDQSYIGVLLDDLVTKTPVEPYRMFSSRAEFRLLLRADNTDERLTGLARDMGLVDDVRWSVFNKNQKAGQAISKWMQKRKIESPFSGQRKNIADWAKEPQVTFEHVLKELNDYLPTTDQDAIADWHHAISQPSVHQVLMRLLADIQYAGFIERQRQDAQRMANQEHTRIPSNLDFSTIQGLRNEAVMAMNHFKPMTFGQAGRLEGVTPADIMVLAIALKK